MNPTDRYPERKMTESNITHLTESLKVSLYDKVF